MFHLEISKGRDQKSSHCLHNRLRKVSLQNPKRRIPFQAAMRLHGIVEIHKTTQFFLPMPRAVKLLFVMLHLHNRPYPPFGFTVGLRTGGTGEFLVDAVLKTSNTKCMVGCAFVLAAVVRIDAFNQIWARFDNVFIEKRGCAFGGFVRQNGGIQLA